MSMRVSKGHSTAYGKHNTVAWSKETAGYISFTKLIFSMNFYSQTYEEVNLVILSFWKKRKENFWEKEGRTSKTPN